MLDLKVLVFEFLAIDGFSTGAVASCKVSPLDHKRLDDPMEARALQQRQYVIDTTKQTRDGTPL